MLWLYYALLIENGILLISVNSIGLLIEALYIVIFLFYATREARKQTLKISFLLSVAFTVMGSGNSFTISGLNLNLGGGSGSAGGASSSMPPFYRSATVPQVQQAAINGQQANHVTAGSLNSHDQAAAGVNYGVDMSQGGNVANEYQVYDHGTYQGGS
ncbi:hypothetical protein POM88_028380 [Heracleum sosnowskyi]|uniref:Uncharacterized protein n=1 Tax=Heracleum sosnowskyi TaxID=360622 RepID=A0AAD8I9S3_9APIA|nr:hypothetical protein POM88_028380 [Heracleum sosnowskyi]